MTASRLALSLRDEADTVMLGSRLAAVLTPGMLVFLKGDLGAGKTTLCRGLIRGLGHAGAVKSPTYTLVEPYELTRPPVYHFDLYRLASPGELDDIGLRDYLDSEHVCLVEWPERGGGVLPPADLIITIETGERGRKADLTAVSPRAKQALARLDGSPPGAAT
ncbi:MAG: tRNA (adenosine(37)-N6)-threonylcarbamoyltransferase complex ATPase subunit type 1 TsaE [Chromatocurvus sp.]